MDLFAKISNGNADAEQFLRIIAGVAHGFDDIVDGDKDISRQEVETLALVLLFDLPRNPFFRAHLYELTALMGAASTNWALSNSFEETGDSAKLSISRILRSSFVDVFTYTAMLCGGAAHGLKMAEDIRLATHHENQTDYESQLKLERRLKSSDQ
jgi:hypothetical protein